MSLTDRLKIALTARPELYDRARRPYAVGRFWLGRPHEIAYKAFGLFPEREGSFLDVGANAGMSALSFRLMRPNDPILSIEPNPFHRDDLNFVGRLVRPFSFRISAAGAEHSTLTLHVPVYNGVPLTSEGSLDRAEVLESPSLRDRLGDGMDGDRFEVREVTVPVIPLDELGARPAFVKLDTQGTELDVLRGLERTIEATKPMLMIETPGAEIVQWLGERGYVPYVYDPAGNRLQPGMEGDPNILFDQA